MAKVPMLFFPQVLKQLQEVARSMCRELYGDEDAPQWGTKFEPCPQTSSRTPKSPSKPSFLSVLGLVGWRRFFRCDGRGSEAVHCTDRAEHAHVVVFACVRLLQSSLTQQAQSALPR